MQDVTDRRTAEEQLRLAHRMESVGRLAGGVAHEANNQMSVVIGAAHFILARPDIPPAVRTDAEYIRQAAERTAAVTAQLLAFSRRQVLRPQVLELNGVLEKFRPVLQRTMGEDCAVTLRLDPALGPGEGRPRPARAGAAQPGAQRARRDAARRHALGRDRDRRAHRGLGRPRATASPSGRGAMYCWP